MGRPETANGVRCVSGETPLQAALNAREDAERDVAETLRKHYPVGAAIAWERSGGKVFNGFVVGHLYGDAIRVRNAATGRTLDVYAWNIARAEGRRHG